MRRIRAEVPDWIDHPFAGSRRHDATGGLLAPWKIQDTGIGTGTISILMTLGLDDHGKDKRSARKTPLSFSIRTCCVRGTGLSREMVCV